MTGRLARLLRRRSDDGAALRRDLVARTAAHLADRDDPLVVVLGTGRDALLAALADAGPGWRVLVADDDPARRQVQLVLAGPADVVLDHPAPAGRKLRFQGTFFHLRPGGLYLVPDAAGELGAEPGPLGEHLARAAAREPEQLRAGRRRPIGEHILLATRMHVTVRADGGHLVLTHDLPDVLHKLDEPQGTAWIEGSGGPHRVLRTIPAEEPPSAEVITEGPERRDPPMDRPVTSADLFLREYRDVVVDVEQLVTTDRVVLPDTYRHNQWTNRLVNIGLADVAPGAAVRVRPLPEPDDLPVLAGTHLHLDNEVRGHFGHTMTEVLSRMWSWPAALDVDPDVRVLVTAARKRPAVQEWEYAFYEACGIPRDRIVTIDRPHRVERLISGSPMFSNPQFVHPAIVETWDRVGDTLAAQAEPVAHRPERIFIGRRIQKRACTNADEVEAIFREHGFAVVYPEDYPLGEQVAMFRAATVVGGYAGSGMFHIAFVPHPVHVIQVGSDTYTPRNEVLMAAVRGHRIDGIISIAHDKGVQAPFAVDLEREGPYLRTLLASL